MTDAALGKAYALATAGAWATGVILFRSSGRYFSPLALSHLKNGFALILYALTLAWLYHDGPLWPLSASHTTYFALSGVGGIALGDTLFLLALARLGASRTAIVECSYCPSVVLFAWLALNEDIHWYHGIGGLLVVAGIVLETTSHTMRNKEQPVDAYGVLFGIASVACTGLSVVAVKPLLSQNPLLPATMARLLGGFAALSLLSAHPRLRTAIWHGFRPQRGWLFALPAALLGTYGALLLWLAGFKYTEASSASILNQSASLLIVILAWLLLREPLNARRVTAVLLGFVGCALVVAAP